MPYDPELITEYFKQSEITYVVVAEWLRRWTRNPLGSPRAGSNPADYVSGQFVQSEQTNFWKKNMIVYRVQHIFTKLFSICLMGGGQSREKGTQAEKKNWRMIYEKCRLVYLDASRNYFELFTWLYMTKIYIDSIYVVSASASEDSTNLPGGVSRLFGTCVASWVCIQITTPRFHCRVIARCAFLTESLKKVSVRE